VVVPHQPYWEQQFPKEDPAHVKPEVPAQDPSVEAFLVGAAAALVVVVAAALVADAPVPEHVPNAELQPVEQWSVVLPHQPYWEQQLPKVEPAQVKPEAPPHEPSVETLPAAEATGALELVVAALVVDVALVVVGATPLLPQLPKPDWQPVPQ
jgi:hypothetical protein